MDENRIAGTARNIGGKAQEGLGSAIGDAKTQAEGVVNQIKGTAQDLYGQARDTASQFADDAAVAGRQAAVTSRRAAVASGRAAASFENALRDAIVSQPFAAVIIAVGIGWVLGRMRLPT
jgi:uncharacterized protein YjbJ (UPF0337 family)